MRSRFSALVAALALVVGSTANAEIYTMYTYPTPGASSLPSTLGLNLNIATLIVVPSGNATGTISGGFLVGDLTGSSEVDMNLDASDSGLLYLTNSAFSLSPLSVTQSGLVFGFLPYSIDLTTTAIGVQLNAGPITVTNGSFVIDSSTVGSLTLNSGLLNYNINIPSVAVASGSIDLAASPITVAFSSLGSVTIPGTADDSASVGFDTVGGVHSGAPGITGSSAIDDAGAEVFVDFSGITVTSTIAVSTALNLPVTITLTGGVSIGSLPVVPEASSVILAGLATTGFLGGLVLRRRRSA